MNALHLGDCLDVMPQIADKSVDAVIADLPYGITKAKWDCEIPLDCLWREYKRIAKPDAPFVLFGSQPFTSKLICSNLPWFRYCWYWEKEKGTGFLNAKKQPLRCIEDICVFYKNSGKYTPQMVPLETPYRHKLPTIATELTNSVASFEEEIQYKEYTHAYPKNLLKYPRDNSNKGRHSTQKPLKLMEYLIKTYTEEGDTILDNVMGSGTTGIAAKKLNRQFIGIEIEEKCYEMAVKAIENTKSRLGEHP